MIYIRDDDVLVGSSSHPDPLKHFKTVHNWICETDRLLHVPTILVTEIQQFPEAIEYIREETKARRMRPEIHGLHHIDYAKLPRQEIEDHLKKCNEFLYNKFEHVPTRFYTPWGANASHVKEAALNVGLQLVDCSALNKLQGRYGIIQRLRDGENPYKFLEEQEVFFHWWEGGMRLKRLIEVLKHGSWETAQAANKDWF